MKMSIYLFTFTAYFKQPSSTNTVEENIIISCPSSGMDNLDSFRSYKFSQFMQRMRDRWADEINFFQCTRHGLPSIAVLIDDVAFHLDDDLTRSTFISLIGEVVSECISADNPKKKNSHRLFSNRKKRVYYRTE